MADLTNYGENLAAQALDGALYAALHTADPGETGVTGELSGDGYTREAVTMTTSGDTVSNSGDIVWGPVTANKGTVTHVSVWDAVTAGNCLYKGALDASFSWPSGTYTIAAGNLTLTLA